MLNGVLAPPLMIIILFISNNAKIMGTRTNGLLSNALGIAITALMSLVSLGLLFQVIFM
jgi:Mn2+/Fe2+ NRAMP family transporter